MTQVVGTPLWVGVPWRRHGIAHRLFDIVVASCALAASAPVMAIVAIAILIETGRPVFFSQNRLGEGGRTFRIHKFRKFHDRPGAPDRPLTLRADARLTRVGRWIERTKIDELPQLWDVLRGTMSLVGPRPELVAFAACFHGRHRQVLAFRPGLFGPSQTAFRNEGALYPGWCDPERFYRGILFPAKAELDLAYYPRRTLLKDAGWIVSGLAAVIGLGGRQTGMAPVVAAATQDGDTPSRAAISQAAE